jgi:D-tyrosyl-tRNA(Tyr) deacylase
MDLIRNTIAWDRITRVIALIQRVSEAAVVVNGNVTGQISRGILALIGVERGDSEREADRLLERLLAYRIFADGEQRMNLDVRQIGGDLLLVPQFTLAADTARGNRPGFSRAAPPAEGERLFDCLVQKSKKVMPGVQTGVFGAHMQVRLVNDGPVTFWLQVPPAA